MDLFSAVHPMHGGPSEPLTKEGLLEFAATMDDGDFMDRETARLIRQIVAVETAAKEKRRVRRAYAAD